MAISKQAVLATLAEKGFSCNNINDYKTLDTELQLTCSKGHNINTTLRVARDSRFKCPICDGKNSLGSLLISENIPAKNGKRIVAIDNATAHAGVSVFDNGQLVYYKLVEFTGDTAQRLVANNKFIKDVVIDKWKPDLIVLEDIQYQQHIQTFKTLAMLLGSTIVAIGAAGIKYETVFSSAWRSHFMISGKRIEEKNKAIQKVFTMYGISVNDDVAEAILLGKYAVDILDAKKPIKLF